MQSHAPDPTEPWVVSCGFASPRTTKAFSPGLGRAAVRLGDVVEGWRVDPSAAAFSRDRSTTLSAMTSGVKTSSVRWKDKRVRLEEWRDRVGGLGERWAVVSLTGGFGKLEADCGLDGRSTVRVASGLVDDGVARQWAHGLVQELREAAADPTLDGGYVHVDTIAHPYEQVMLERAGLRKWGPPAFVDGYYWALLLSPRQLARLGGMAAVGGEAPVEHVEKVGDHLLCVLCEDPTQLGPAQVAAWRRFLQPVLIPGYPRPSEGHTNWPRPNWLQEGPSIPGATDTAIWGKQDPSPESWPVHRTGDPSGSRHRIDIAGLVEGRSTEGIELAHAAIRAWAIVGRTRGVALQPVRFEVVGPIQGTATGVTFTIETPDPTVPLERLAKALQTVDTELGIEPGDAVGAMTVESFT